MNSTEYEFKLIFKLINTVRIIGADRDRLRAALEELVHATGERLALEDADAPPADTRWKRDRIDSALLRAQAALKGEA